MTQTGVVTGGCLTDWISLGVLASAVPRDAVDVAIEVTGKAAKRAGGKLPPHVMVYFAMALALFGDDDYEEVAARLAGTLAGWHCWDEATGGDDPDKAAFPKARVVTISECASHAMVDARIGGVAGKGAGSSPWPGRCWPGWSRTGC